MAATVFNFKDFRGGFFDTSYPNELMKDNECYQLENVWWNGGLKKRGGVQKTVTFTSSLRGAVRHKIGATWYTFVAIEGNGSTNLFYNKTGATDYSTITKLDDNGSVTTLAFTASASFSFARIHEQIVAVNGVDKEHLIFPTVSTVYGQTLEKYDTRYRNDKDWYAGQLTGSAGAYTNDTTDAQNSTTANFQITSNTNSGMWIAADLTYNKFVVKTSVANSDASFTFQYYGKASSAASLTWNTATPIATATWTVASNKVVEFNVPVDPNTRELLFQPLGKAEADAATANFPSVMKGRFCTRMISNHVNSGSLTSQGLELQHTQYLSQLNVNYKASKVAQHRNHVVLGYDNWFRMSPIVLPAAAGAVGEQTVKGWRGSDLFGADDGGGNIQAFVPHLDYLAVLTEGRIYGLKGNSFANYDLKPLSPDLIGPVSGKSATVVKSRIYFVARDGVYTFDGTNLVKVSSHIEETVGALTLTDAVSTEYLGRLWISFPSNSVTLVADPDTIRQDEDGDFRLSFYKHTGFRVDQFLDFRGTGDTGAMQTMDHNKNFMLRMNTGEKDIATTSVTITAKFQSRYHDFGNQLTDKAYEMFKPLVGDVSQTQGVNYTLKFYTRSRYGFASSSAVLTASVSSGIHTEDLTIPPDQDGKNLGVYMEHDYKTEAKFIGYSVAVEEKPF